MIDIEKDIQHAPCVRLIDFRNRVGQHVDREKMFIVTVKDKPKLVVVPWEKWQEYMNEFQV